MNNQRLEDGQLKNYTEFMSTSIVYSSINIGATIHRNISCDNPVSLVRGMINAHEYYMMIFKQLFILSYIIIGTLLKLLK